MIAGIQQEVLQWTLQCSKWSSSESIQIPEETMNVPRMNKKTENDTVFTSLLYLFICFKIKRYQPAV